MLFLSYWHPVSAKEASTDQQLKTGHVYNFTKFVVWPEAFKSSFNICFLASNPFRKLLDPKRFVNHACKIKLQVNTQSGFKINSKLLEVAELTGERHE